MLLFLLLFNTIVRATPPDFVDISLGERQQVFFSYLLPKVAKVNKNLLAKRQRILNLQQQYKNTGKLPRNNITWLQRVAADYRIQNFAIIDPKHWQLLLKRVDMVPASIVLAQAANETAWGTSRFAQDGANYFGQWCYSRGCGLVPKNRTIDAKHEVRVFNSVIGSISSYKKNLNTHPAYREFRKLRAQARTDERAPLGLELVQALTAYSELGESYVVSISHLIEQYQLQQYDDNTMEA